MKHNSRISKLILAFSLVFSLSSAALAQAEPAIKGRVLVVVSSATELPLKEGMSYPVGVFLGELAEPAEAMLKAGYQLTFISPHGKAPGVDQDSLKKRYFGFSNKRMNRARAVWDDLLTKGLSNPLVLEEVAGDEYFLSQFDALFIPGGHGPLVDLYRRNAPSDMSINTDMGKILLYFHTQNRPTGLICHAPVALAAAPKVDGEWIYKGYKITGVSRITDFLNEDFPFTKVFPGHENEYLQNILIEAGANYKKNIVPGVPYTVEDRELLTGQDPFAAELMAKDFVKKLNRYMEHKH